MTLGIFFFSSSVNRLWSTRRISMRFGALLAGPSSCVVPPLGGPSVGWVWDGWCVKYPSKNESIILFRFSSLPVVNPPEDNSTKTQFLSFSVPCVSAFSFLSWFLPLLQPSWCLCRFGCPPIFTESFLLTFSFTVALLLFFLFYICFLFLVFPVAAFYFFLTSILLVLLVKTCPFRVVRSTSSWSFIR